jgi:hypothetical protein
MAPAERLYPAPLADAIARALRNTNAWQRLREGAWLNSVKFCREKHVNGLCHLFKLIAG